MCGHAGDGDLHPTTFDDKDNPKAPSTLEAANNEIVEAAFGLGGTITGEHGVGTEKIQFMTKRSPRWRSPPNARSRRRSIPPGCSTPGSCCPTNPR